MTNKIQIPIYQINTGLEVFEEKSHEQIVDFIVERQNSKIRNRNNKYRPQQLTQDTAENFRLRLFYAHRQKHPKWKDFFSEICDRAADILTASNREVSYIMFLYDDDHIFSFCGGIGNLAIQDYINTYFGMEIISRLIEENNKVIKQVDERDLTGAILATSRYFRYDYKLSDDEEFGKLYKKVRAEVGRNVIDEKFGINTNSRRRTNIGCVAKSTFQINKSVSFNEVSHVIRSIANLLSCDANFELNKVRLITRRGSGNKLLIEELENTLCSKIYDGYVDRINDLDFDICHTEFEKFFSAISYNLYLGHATRPIFQEELEELRNFGFIYDAIEASELVMDNAQEMKAFLKKVRIRSNGYDGESLTEGSLFKHIHGEIRINDINYFYIDGDWYQIQDQFLENLNNQSRRIIIDIRKNDILNLTWNTTAIQTENEYNRQYIGNDGYIVLDKIFVKYIEICDILKYDEENLYLIHVKKGFNNSTRDLTSQINISARMIREIQDSGDYTQIEELYDSLANKLESTDNYFRRAAGQINSIDKNSFVSLFREKRIYYCLAFVDDAAEQRNISDIDSFDSNIAKFSLVQLYKNMRLINIDLKVSQINRPV